MSQHIKDLKHKLMHHRDDCPSRFVIPFQNLFFPKEMLQPRETLRDGLISYGCDGDYNFLESIQKPLWPQIIISSSKINYLFPAKYIYFSVIIILSQIIVLFFF